MLAMPSDSPEPANIDGEEPPKEDPQAKNIKVVLDIDDAPFLQEDKPEPAPVAPKPAKPQKNAEPEEKPVKLSLAQRIKALLFGSKKRIIITASILVLVLAGLGGGAFFLLSGDTSKTPKPAAKGAHGPNEPRVIVLNSTIPVAEEPVPYVHLVSLEPFTIPMTGSEGETRFLTLTIAIGAESDVQKEELTGRMLQIRDAIYYFLINRPLTLLQTEQAAESFKQDLVSVINEHMTIEKIRQIYLQEYLVIGP
jgi:Flagellar basal body-associated protein